MRVVIFAGNDAITRSVIKKLTIKNREDGVRFDIKMCSNTIKSQTPPWLFEEFLYWERGHLNYEEIISSQDHPLGLPRMHRNIHSFEYQFDVNSDVANAAPTSDTILALSLRVYQRFSRRAINHWRASGIPLVNLHLGLLPAYRGILPTFWAMKNRDHNYGYTLHLIDEDFDVGPIVSKVELPIDYAQSVLCNNFKLTDSIVSSIEEAILWAISKQIVTQDQDASSAAYFSYPTQCDLIEFIGAGNALFSSIAARDFHKELLEI